MGRSQVTDSVTHQKGLGSPGGSDSQPTGWTGDQVRGQFLAQCRQRWVPGLRHSVCLIPNPLPRITASFLPSTKQWKLIRLSLNRTSFFATTYYFSKANSQFSGRGLLNYFTFSNI